MFPKTLLAVFVCGSLLSARAAIVNYSFAGNNTGAIPDAVGATPGQRIVDFNVMGLPSNPLTMRLSLTFVHSWMGDLDVVLSSPGGTAFTIFSRVGKTTPASLGDSSNLDGTYDFFDLAAGNLWTAAAAKAGNDAVTQGNYRTSAAGASTPTSFSPAFSSLSPAQVNGQWKLTLRDFAVGDLGNISAARLTISAVPEPSTFLAGALLALPFGLHAARRLRNLKPVR